MTHADQDAWGRELAELKSLLRRTTESKRAVLARLDKLIRHMRETLEPVTVADRASARRKLDRWERQAGMKPGPRDKAAREAAVRLTKRFEDARSSGQVTELELALMLQEAVAAEDAAGIYSPIRWYVYRLDEPRFAQWYEPMRRAASEGVNALTRLMDSEEAAPAPSFEVGSERLARLITRLRASLEAKKTIERRERRTKIRERFERPGFIGNENVERQTDGIRRAIVMGLDVVAGQGWLDPTSDEGKRALERGGSVGRKQLDPDGYDWLELLLALNEPDRFGRPPRLCHVEGGGRARQLDSRWAWREAELREGELRKAHAEDWREGARARPKCTTCQGAGKVCGAKCADCGGRRWATDAWAYVSPRDLKQLELRDLARKSGVRRHVPFSVKKRPLRLFSHTYSAEQLPTAADRRRLGLDRSPGRVSAWRRLSRELGLDRGKVTLLHRKFKPIRTSRWRQHGKLGEGCWDPWTAASAEGLGVST
jgi:hypothetical protein